MDDLIISDVGRIRGILKERRLRLGRISVKLLPVFDTRYPFDVDLFDAENNCVGIVSGKYCDLHALKYQEDL